MKKLPHVYIRRDVSEEVLMLGYSNADEYNVFINDAVLERVKREKLEVERDEEAMKCVHCNTTFYGEVEIDEWNACPVCSKRMLGFRDDMLNFAVECLLNDVQDIGKKLHMLRERLRQNRGDQR